MGRILSGNKERRVWVLNERGVGEGEEEDVPNAHADETTVPTLDDLTGAELKRERLVAIERRVKLGAVLQGTLSCFPIVRKSGH